MNTFRMSRLSALFGLRGKNRKKTSRGLVMRRLSWDPLEDRIALTTLTVLNLDDGGPGSLRATISSASNGDTIEFGSLSGTITLTSGYLNLNKDLTIQGPGADVLSISGNNAHRVFEVQSGTTNTLSGLTITEGASYAAINNYGTLTVTNSTLTLNAGDYGGGVYNDSSASLTLVDSTISGNTGDYGGGIYNGGMLVLVNSSVSGNTGDSAGGIYNRGMLEVTNSTILYNTSLNGNSGGIYNTGTVTVTSSSLIGNTGQYVGGIYNNDGVMELTEVNINNNSAPQGYSGGIYNYNGTMELTGANINNNSAPQGYSGGIYSYRGELTLADSTISGNTGDRSGGIYSQCKLEMTNCTVSYNLSYYAAGGILNWDTVTLTNSTVSNNYAAVYGGGIVNNYGTVTLTGSTVSGNTAAGGNGGGIYNWDTLSLTNSTVSGNYANGNGGGVLNGPYNATLTLTSTTISDNTASQGGGVFNSVSSSPQFPGATGTINAKNSIVAGNNGGQIDGGGTVHNLGNNLLSGDPKLGPLQDNGGPSQTMLPRWDSPALNAGDDAAVSGLTYDQRGDGFPRILGTHVDIGAVEIVPPDTFEVTTAADVVDAGDGVTSLREAILAANADSNYSTITFSASLNGTPIVLSLTGAGEDGSTTGDLDISSDVGIQGNGATHTLLDASSLGDRALHVLSSASLNLDGVTISGGHATSGSTSNMRGGGIFNQSTLTVSNSTVADNVATFAGGGIFNLGDLTILNSTISGNRCRDSTGGGISNTGGTATIVNSTISGNSNSGGIGGPGGGIFNGPLFNGFTIIPARLTATNSTIYGNTASDFRGPWSGAGIVNGGGSTATLNNCIIAGNLGLSDLDGTFSGTNNLVQDGSGSGLVNTVTGAPLLGPLQNNGGPTFTHALLIGSPALDAGDNNAASGLTTDQRGAGFTRVYNGAVDIGAFESGVTNQPPTITSNGGGATATVSVAEGGASVTQVTANDPDAGQVLSYSIVGGLDATKFTIDNSAGFLVFNAAPNFETPTDSDADNVYEVTVQVSDGQGGTDTQAISVTVTNVAPSTSSDSDGAANSVTEGAANGTAVGITASSTDPLGPSVTFSLTNDAGGRFAINASTGVVTVANAALLNYEDAASHTITVQASDGAGGTATQTFTIAVTNVGPSTPIDSNGAANRVSQGAANGTAVGITASASDPNGTVGGGGVSYSLTNDAGGRFAINATTGVVTVANSSLIRSGTSYSITVQASDGVGGISTQTFTISASSNADAVTALYNRVIDAQLERGTANALTTKLLAAILSFNMGNNIAGVNQLNAFINHVRAQKGKSIADALADSFTAEAQAIIDSVR